MNFLDVILSRRSIRKFTREAVNDELLTMILKAGFAAPSAHNRQPWEFVVVKEPERLNKIATFHPYAKMLPEAGCGIVVCGDLEKQQTEGFLISDCSAAIQNMLLAIHGLNLGGVWCGIYPKEQLMTGFRETLNLPDYIIPVGLVVVGHRNEDKPSRNSFDESKIHFNKW